VFAVLPRSAATISRNSAAHCRSLAFTGSIPVSAAA
jgi:hypothetical protein